VLPNIRQKGRTKPRNSDKTPRKIAALAQASDDDIGCGALTCISRFRWVSHVPGAQVGKHCHQSAVSALLEPCNPVGGSLSLSHAGISPSLT
jgi:hypothetical protein